MAKLSKEHIMTIETLHDKGVTNSAIARTLGVTEGTVRYHVKRRESGASDGRARKRLLIERLNLDMVAAAWWRAEAMRLESEGRPPSVRALHTWLVDEHDYRGSYKSVLKFARANFPRPKRRPFRRVETPPGAQMQTDWGEYRGMEVGDPGGPTTLYAFTSVLSFSRMPAVVWSRSMKQLAWHRCHNEALIRLGGVAAVNRIDNLKTGIAAGAGAFGRINPAYQRYARTMCFHIDAHEAAAPQQKGKVERMVGIGRTIDPRRCRFETLDGLQTWTDDRIIESAKRRICPATGKTIYETWLQDEVPLLRPLPDVMPEPFDVAVRRPVYKDCTVRFENRTYPVPFAYVGDQVEVRGCDGVVQIVDRCTGTVLRSHPRGTDERILIDSTCYEGPSTETVEAPRPLGRMARKLQEIAETPVEQRPLDLYAALAEVARS